MAIHRDRSVTLPICRLYFNPRAEGIPSARPLPRYRDYLWVRGSRARRQKNAHQKKTTRRRDRTGRKSTCTPLAEFTSSYSNYSWTVRGAFLSEACGEALPSINLYCLSFAAISFDTAVQQRNSNERKG